MKIFLTLLAICSLQSSIAQTRYVTLFGPDESVELKPTDIVEIVGATNGQNEQISFFRAGSFQRFSVVFNKAENVNRRVKHIFTGMSSASLNAGRG